MRTHSAWLKLLAAVFMFSSLAVAAHKNHDDHEEHDAQKVSWGPKLGTSLPQGLKVKTHEGKKIDVAELATGKGVAIAFVRSADWCPFCKRQIIDLNKSLDEFTKRDINLVVLSYDDPKVLGEFVEKHDIGYTLLSDKKSAVIDAFGIRNKEHEKGSSGYGIPHPGIMVFDASGTLIAKFAEEGYRKRPPVEGVLAAIDRNMSM